MSKPGRLVRNIGRLLKEYYRPGESDISGRALWFGGRVVLTLVIVVTNLIGACTVLVLASFVVPLPELGDPGHVRLVNAAVTGAYVAIAVPIGIVFGTRRLLRLRDWMLAGRPATAQEQRLLLRAPLRLFLLQMGLWLAAAAVFAALNSTYSGELAVRVGIVVTLTGAVTAACAYLLTERILRGLAARALAHGMPEKSAVPGVATRFLLAWSLGTGIPVLGLIAIGILVLAGDDAERTELAVSMIVLGGIGIVVGAFALAAAARLTADPVDSVRRALERVQQGELDVQVPVYDGTQIGRLQLGFNRMVKGLSERERIREAFGTYVDPDVLERVLAEGTSLEGEEVEVTIMFIDVRDFTGFAERTPAPGVLAAINRLFAVVVPIIREHGGRIDKFIGDGLLAVFGAPRRLPDHADRALDAALEIERAVKSGKAGDLEVGIGLNSGTVVAGNVGGSGRLEFSVIGDAVNVAARVEAATRDTGDTILLAERTKELLTQQRELTERAGITLKGKSEVVCLYAPAGGNIR